MNYARDLDKKILLINYIFTFSISIIICKVILQIVIALTTRKAEYITIMKTVKEAIWLEALIVILGRLQRRLYGFITKNVIHLINNQIFHESMKYIEVRHYFVQTSLSKIGYSLFPKLKIQFQLGFKSFIIKH